MVDEISAFNLEGHISLGCCCGHGVYAKTVVYQDGDLIKEWYSGVVIPRRRRYYLTDDEGYYYIPELFTKEGYIL
jgi:hypothetical protein